MSNYGKKYELYDPIVNLRRKSRNTNEDTKEKCYSTRIGQLSNKQQVTLDFKKYQKLNKKQPVKIYTKEEIQKLKLAS